MARIRTIKPEFWRSPDIMELSFFQRLLYIGLWNLADDEGRGKYEPASIAADLFLTEFSLNPHGTVTEVSNAFFEYSNREMIVIYEVKKRRFFQILNWSDHQKPNRPSASKLPPPTSADAVLIEGSLSPHAHLTETSLPEQGTGNREQGTSTYVQNTEIEPPTDTHTTPPKKDNKPTNQQPEAETPDELFAKFWEHYPLKRHKKEARQQFDIETKTIDPHTIIAGAERLANDPNLPDEGFQPLPETWLSGHRWNDPPYPFRPNAWQNTTDAEFLASMTRFPSFQAENDF